MRLTREQQKQLIEESPATIGMLDRELRYIAASPRWMSDYDLSGPLAGRAHYEVFPDLPERWKLVHRLALGGEVVEEEEDRYERADGSVMWQRWQVRPWFDAGDIVGGIIIFSEDMTARKHADEQRRLFADLVDGTRDCIGICDARFAPMFVNRAGLEMVGLDSLETARRFEAQDWFFPEDRNFVTHEFFPRVLRDARAETTIRFRHFVSGDALWMEYSAFSLTDPAGKLKGFATIGRDIGERRRSQQRLAETQKRLEAIMRAAPVGISYSDDASCARVSGNAALLAQFDMQPNDNVSASAADDDAPGRRVRYFSEGRQLAERELPLQKAVAERREIPPTELRVVLPNGRQWFAEASAAPVIDDQGAIIGGVAVTVDITERLATEAALRAADRRKDEFLAVLAHELRNPLAPIRYGIDVLDRTGPHDPATMRILETMKRQVSHLTRLVDELLDVARITSGKISLKCEPVDVGQAIGHAIESVYPAFRAAGHRLSYAAAPAPLIVNGDVVRLTQIFANLLSNAAKYTPSPGRIDVDASAQGDAAVIRVRDNGRGIPADMLSSIFELFTQIENTAATQGDGIGVGLALSRRLVELHGGLLKAQSEGPGLGSEFIVRIPLMVADMDTRTKPNATRTESTKRRRVLVVDDEKDVADGLVLLLQCLGAETRVAYSGAEALLIIPAFQPELVFLDLGMPEMDGLETARRLRKSGSYGAFRLLALTGWGQEADRRRSVDAGFDAHFVKPIDVETLKRLLADGDAN